MPKLNTMSGVMDFISELEGTSASFYQAQAEKHPALADSFTAWAKENLKFEKQVKQTYFGIITDTLESNYCFEGLDSDDFRLEIPQDPNEAAAKTASAAMEETIRGFYTKTADLSEGLMADLPRLFRKIVKKTRTTDIVREKAEGRRRNR